MSQDSRRKRCAGDIDDRIKITVVAQDVREVYLKSCSATKGCSGNVGRGNS